MAPLISRFNALLVEGVPGIGKSTLIDALARRHLTRVAPGKIRTFLHLCQAHTMGPLARAEDASTLTPMQNRAHLDRIVGLLEWLHDAVGDQRQPSGFVLLDTLHVTQCLRPGLLAWSDVEAFDRRLAALGCKLLLLRGSADVVWERCVRARADWWLNGEYAGRFGRAHEDVHAYFLEEQERFIEISKHSALKTLILDNNGRVDDVIDMAHESWYSLDALGSFQRPLGTMPAHELEELQKQFVDNA